MTEIKHIITEDWEEELLRNLVGDEEIAMLKYPVDINNKENTEFNDFDSQTEYLEITIKRIPK